MCSHHNSCMMALALVIEVVPHRWVFNSVYFIGSHVLKFTIIVFCFFHGIGQCKCCFQCYAIIWPKTMRNTTIKNCANIHPIAWHLMLHQKNSVVITSSVLQDISQCFTLLLDVIMLFKRLHDNRWLGFVMTSHQLSNFLKFCQWIML